MQKCLVNLVNENVFVFIEILFKMLLFKGGVLIYAEHCIYTVHSTNIGNLGKYVNMVKTNLHGLYFLSFIKKINKIPTYHWSKTIESGGGDLIVK